MIRRCTDADLTAIEAVINDGSQTYRGVIPPDCWHEPYMTESDLRAEVAAGVNFWCWEETGEVLGVMGLQAVRDVALIRHAYVRLAHQGRGIGSALLKALTHQAAKPLLVGTWAAAEWAIRFYERHRFSVVPVAEKNRLLSTYWNLPSRQRETSVVLVYAAEQ